MAKIRETKTGSQKIRSRLQVMILICLQEMTSRLMHLTSLQLSYATSSENQNRLIS